MTNLERMSPTERLGLCKKYFFIGLAFLPLVWLVNCVWFYRYAFCAQTPDSDEKKSMKKYISFSFAGLVFWTVMIITWLCIYTAGRVERADWAETLTFIFPLGRV
ncbi:Gamma-secretase subunit PEN-2 [Aphelenchoides bicaudatus]|nr:Gamma-secretase subunit PEN-2 [Aphelenchoides bicaudatus]